MKSFAMTLNLKEDVDVIEKYKEYHRAVVGRADAHVPRARSRSRRR